MDKAKKIKPTVLFITNQGGGAPKSLLNMVKSLRNDIHAIVLFENDQYDYKDFVSEGIECIIVPFRMNMVLNLPGYKTIKWKIHRFWDEFFKNGLAPTRVEAALKKHGVNKVDFVHTNTGALTIGLAIAKKLHARHVWHLREFQDIDFDAFPYCGWKKFQKLIYQSDAVIGITKAIAKHFHFEKHPQSYVVWDAVASKEVATLDMKKEDYILYCSSMIYHGKGLHDLIVAYGKSKLPENGVKLLVAGTLEDEQYKETISKLIEDYNVQNMVQFEGHQNNLKKYMVKARCFVLPSLNEGLGRVVIEAMLYGCPVIVRDSGGPQEYISHGINGYKFTTNEELTQLLNDVVYQDPIELVQNAQTYAITHFSEEVYGPEILKIYEELMR